MSYQVANGSALDGLVRRVADDTAKTVSFSVSAGHASTSRTERATRATTVTDPTTDR